MAASVAYLSDELNQYLVREHISSSPENYIIFTHKLEVIGVGPIPWVRTILFAQKTKCQFNYPYTRIDWRNMLFDTFMFLLWALYPILLNGLLCSSLCTFHLKNILGLRIGISDIQGWGIWTTRTFSPGDLICQYRGERMTQEQLDVKYQGKSCEYAVKMAKSDQFLIAGDPIFGPGRLINHSDKPNAEFVTHLHDYDPTNPTVEVIALRYINQDREILVSYGDEF